jgi:predicted Zn-ribbon and HTH transcriptional regulator
MGERAELWAVLAGIGLALIFVAIYLYRDRCPKCGHHFWREEIKAERIPGSEHKATTMTDANQGTRTEIRARFRVLYQCRHCGYRFRKTEARTNEQ